MSRAQKNSIYGIQDTITTKEPPSQNLLSIDIQESINYINNSDLDNAHSVHK